MTDRDPLATPTLARLYMGQGYFDRSRATLESCLRRDPFDGHALALVRRLQARTDATLGVVVVRDRAQLKWTAVADAEACSVVLVAITQSGATAATWVTSTRCKTAFGSWDCALPFLRGSIAACVGRVQRGCWQPLAVARPVSWP